MARPKQEFCSNCNGENPKCKYKETGRKCRVGKAKGKAKGKAIGKAKGKAISKETIEKRDNYDSLLGDFQTDYLNFMFDRAFKYSINKETNKVEYEQKFYTVYSFERYLNNINQKSLASWARRKYGENMKNFNTKTDKMTSDEYEKFIYRKTYGKKDDAIREKLNNEQPKTTDEIEELRLKQEQVSKDITGTQSLEEATEIANEIERKLKECDLKSMTDEEALKEIADLANEIDLSWFK